jgi:hypothetical protein
VLGRAEGGAGIETNNLGIGTKVGPAPDFLGPDLVGRRGEQLHARSRRRAAGGLDQAVEGIEDGTGGEPAAGIAQRQQGGRQERRPAVAGVADAPPAAAQPGRPGRAERVGQQHGQVHLPPPQLPGHRNDSLRPRPAVGAQVLVEPVAAGEDVGDVGLADGGDAGAGVTAAQGAQRRRGHHRVPDPARHKYSDLHGG